MRVKLSYTVEEDDILTEAAKILLLASDGMKQVIELFQAIPASLSTPDEAPSTAKALDMLDELRKALFALDTRAMEVVDIVEGYEAYRLKSREAPEDTTLVAPGDGIGGNE